MRNSSETLICYYQGAYGFTIRIDVRTKEWLEYFKENIILLRDGVIKEIEVTCLDNVEIDNLKSLTLVGVKRKKHSKVSILKDCVIWSQDIEEIITLIGLIDGLLEGSGSGHQYLTNEGDNVLIVLGYKETR